MNYLLELAVMAALFGMITVATWAMSKSTALICLSNSGWFGLGAYLSAVLTVRYGIAIPYAIVSSILVTLLASYLIGLLVSKSEADEFALTTFGIAFILFDGFNNAGTLAGGGRGFFGIPTLPGALGTSVFVAITLLGVQVATLQWIQRKPIWALLTAVGDDLVLADMLGKPVLRAKALLYSAVSAVCGTAGALYAHATGFLDPAFFRPALSVYFIAMIALGRRRVLAPILGAVVFVVVPEVINAIARIGDRSGYLRQLIFGIALVFGILFFSTIGRGGRKRQWPMDDQPSL